MSMPFPVCAVRVLAIVLFGTSIVAPAGAASDPMAELSYLVGTWTCSFDSGKQHATYTAHFSYGTGNSWMREIDSWPGGGGDEALITSDPKSKLWTTSVVEAGTTTLFVGKGDPAHVVYHTVYPDANATERLDRVSAKEFTVHFAGMLDGQQMSSSDVCKKSP
jgi:hypothetical protein